MPVLDILAEDGGLRWDACGRLEAVLYYSRKPNLRAEYEARWRAEHKHLLPEGKRLFTRTTHAPAKAFSGHLALRGGLRKARERVERIGTALWLQAVLSREDPPSATENRVSFALQELYGVSRSTIKRDWSDYRGIVHFCAAIAYQRRVFRAPFLHYPDLGPHEYSMDAALFDFLRLAHQFFAFARDSGCFAPTRRFSPQRDLWTMPSGLETLAPARHETWPDCHRIRAILPDAAVIEALAHYDASLFRA